MTTPEYILMKFRENPEYRFYDIMTPNRAMVEFSDNDSFTNVQAADLLETAFKNLRGTFIVKIRTKARKALSAGGDVKTGVAEYTTMLGSTSSNDNNNSNTSIQGIGYLEQLYTEKNNITQLQFNHQLELFKKDMEIKELKDKLKAKNSDGLNGSDKMIAAGIAKAMGVDLSMFMPSSPVPLSVNGVNPGEQDNEARIIAAIDKLSSINPEFTALIENLTNTLAMYPDRVQSINLFFEKTASGVPLMEAFQVFMM